MTTHRCPPGDESVTPCCGRTPFELPVDDRITADEGLVDCDRGFASDGVVQVDERRHILVGDLDALEWAIADYVARWGENWTGVPYMGEFGPNIAGLPTAVANMAGTVIRKNIVASFTEKVTLDAAAVDRELQAKAAQRRAREAPQS